MIRNLARLLSFVRPYARAAALALAVLVVLVALDLALPRLVQHVIDEGIAHGDRDVVVRTAAGMLGLAALSAVLAVVSNHLSVRVGEAVARDLREALFTRIQYFSFGNLDRQRTGELLVRLTSDVGAVKSLVQISLRIGTRAPLLMVGSLILMVRTSADLALLLVPLLLLTTGLIALFVARMEPLFRRVQSRLDAVNDVLHENVAGVRVVRAFVRGEHEASRFGGANEEMASRATEVMQAVSSMTPTLTLCINVGVVLVIWRGGLASIAGALTVGQIVAFTNYLMTTMTPLVMTTMLSNTWAAGLASLARLEGVLDVVPDVRDAADATPIDETAAPAVRFDDVAFRYGGERAEAVLQGVTLAARPGATIGILGATGAGKSTLVQLIPRFYDATHGAVTAFGRDVRRVTRASLLRRIGWVAQEALLFSGTVRDNVRYGRPDASDADVEAAARAAEAHAFVSEMPGGYDARVDPRGANLSGGQKQRLAIARALLVDPDVLILDDATSAVDVETETRIQAALARHREDRTTFVVAQRVSTVLDADLVVVLDHGRIVAQGTHAELLASSPVYREIVQSQLGSGEAAREEPSS